MSMNTNNQTAQAPPVPAPLRRRKDRHMSIRLRGDVLDFYKTHAVAMRRNLNDMIGIALEDQATTLGFKPAQESAPSG